VTRSSLAVGADRTIAPGRVMSIRLFDGHIHRLALLALVELAIVILAVHGAISVRLLGASDTPVFDAAADAAWPQALLTGGVMLLSLAALGLYQLRQRARFSGIVVRLLVAVLLAHAALGIVFYVAPSLHVGRGAVLLVGMFAFGGLVLSRCVFLRVVDEAFFKRRVLVLGTGRRAATIMKRLRRRTDQRGFRIVGYVRTPGDGSEVPERDIPHYDGDLARLALRLKVEEIVVAMDDRRTGFPTAELLECRLRGIHVCEVVAFIERETGRLQTELVEPSWLIFSNGFRCDIFRVAGKRVFDILASVCVLVLAAPFALLTALAIFLEDRGPILYRQVRAGQDGRPFTMFKFRSMTVDAEAEGRALWAEKNDARITRVGGFIRRFRIDELPQVLNVLLGDMSFVGPRPERPAFVAQLTKAIPYYPERHFVKPGITGWAQVRYSYGSSENDAREKLAFDLYYVKHHNLMLDLVVLLQTVEIVLFRIGSR
jgi:sugar transferase (PEP-CTERM system associated)